MMPSIRLARFRFAAALIPFAALSVASLQAQEEGKQDDGSAPATATAPEPKDILVEALGRMQAQEGFSFTGEVEGDEPEDEEDGAAGGVIVRTVGAGDQENHFLGAFEYQRLPGGVTVARSTETSLPRFEHLAKGKKNVTALRYSKEPMTPGRALDELGRLSDWERMTSALAAVDTVESKVRGGQQVVSFMLPKSYLQAEGIEALIGGDAPTASVEITIDANGRCAEARFEVKRSSRLSGLLEGGLGGANVRVVGGAGGSSLDDLPDEIRDMVEGELGKRLGGNEEVTVYRVRIGKPLAALAGVQKRLMPDLEQD